jgi:hypothetical protein
MDPSGWRLDHLQLAKSSVRLRVVLVFHFLGPCEAYPPRPRNLTSISLPVVGTKWWCTPQIGLPVSYIFVAGRRRICHSFPCCPSRALLLFLSSTTPSLSHQGKTHCRPSSWLANTHHEKSRSREAADNRGLVSVCRVPLCQVAALGPTTWRSPITVDPSRLESRRLPLRPFSVAEKPDRFTRRPFSRRALQERNTPASLSRSPNPHAHPSNGRLLRVEEGASASGQ